MIIAIHVKVDKVFFLLSCKDYFFAWICANLPGLGLKPPSYYLLSPFIMINNQNEMLVKLKS